MKKITRILIILISIFINIISVNATSITNIKDDPLKILVFSMGCAIGSMLGSYIEEKIDKN